jgi:hypothetical protein
MSPSMDSDGNKYWGIEFVDKDLASLIPSEKKKRWFRRVCLPANLKIYRRENTQPTKSMKMALML